MATYPLMNFESLTIIVADLEAAVADWTDKLGWRPRDSNEQMARFGLDGTWINLVGPMADQPTGVAQVIVSVDDLAAVFARLQAAGAEVMKSGGGVAINPSEVNGIPLMLVQAPRDAPERTSQWRRLNHLVVAVRDDDSAQARWAELFGVWPVHQVPGGEAAHHVPVGAAWFGLTGSGTDAGALSKFIERRGEGIYAIGLNVAVRAAVVDDLRARGAELIEAPTQTFVHPRTTHGVLIDIVGS